MNDLIINFTIALTIAMQNGKVKTLNQAYNFRTAYCSTNQEENELNRIVVNTLYTKISSKL